MTQKSENPTAVTAGPSDQANERTNDMAKEILGDYEDFVKSKATQHVAAGFEPSNLGSHLFDFQASIVEWACKRGRAAIFADTGLGKAQPVDELVLTPTGWSPIGDVSVGDCVIGSDGLPTNVIGVFPQGIRKISRVLFSDGAECRADDDHLWSVATDLSESRGNEWRVMTTAKIRDDLRAPDGRSKWRVPMVAVEGETKELAIDPYVLGILLGDGCLTGRSTVPTFTTVDEWIVSEIDSRLPSGFRCAAISSKDRAQSYAISRKAGVGVGSSESVVMASLRALGLWGVDSFTKFIPHQYYSGSRSQRMALLRGLMDSDGWTGTATQFTSSNEALALDVCELVRSLGGTARITSKWPTYDHLGERRVGARAYAVTIKTPFTPFLLPRKVSVYESSKKTRPVRKITEVIDAGEAECVCIKVSASDSLYVTRDYVVTHNTAMQTEWARQVHEFTGGDVLIAAPLCVAQQTVEEAAKFGVHIRYCRSADDVKPGITITNYEMIEKFNPADFAGIVLDESSILKAHDSKTRARIIGMFGQTPYRLSCTATPSPNDHMELGNQAEFLGVMTATEMLAMYFVHDGGDTSQWRLKGHGKTRFWEWMSTWAVCIRNPADLGFDGSRYVLPGLQMHEHVLAADAPLEGQLFAGIAQTLTERRQAKRESMAGRIKLAADLVNSHSRPAIVWCHLNDESKALAQSIPDAIEVTGSMSADEKESAIMAFTHGEKRVIVTKGSIAGFGMNWQHCADQVFAGLDDSYETFYQCIRRSYRFGQSKIVNVHLVSSESEGAVKANLERKQAQADDMAQSMVTHMRELTKQQIKGVEMEKSEYKREAAKGEGWTVHLGDCVEVASEMPDDSIDFSVFSPPFASLYTYSNSDRDMGNCRDYAEFYGQFKFLVKQLLRVTKPGRLLSFHCMNLQTSKFRDGVIGLHDFRGELTRMFVEAGWIFHSEVCIWKDPVTAMQRTKALGLLHKTIRKDSSMSRQGIPDYLVTMRKPGDNPEPISHTHESFPVQKWQKYASPVWMDVNPSRTLQFKTARESDDERHICPLQLDVIERAMELWSNPGDLVFSPFTGIGSEGYVALEMGRKFIGAELKRSYWELAKRNLSAAREHKDSGLFNMEEIEQLEAA